MKQSVTYLLSGPAHLPYLTVSLYTLRKHYDGRIQVFAWPESHDIVKQIAQDSNLNIEVHKRIPEYRRKDGVKGNAQFIDKIDLMMCIYGGANLYLDADTIIQGSLDYLFEQANEYGFVATQWNNWETNSGIVKKRISRLLGREGINQESVKRVLDIPAPSVNGGVFACQPDSPVLDTWYNWTLKVKDIFIADECVLHALIGEYENTQQFGIVVGGKFNCGPKFKPKKFTDEDIVIWHGHGDSFVRPNKSPRGVKLWYPIFVECLSKNVGNMADWVSSIENKYLNRVIGMPEECCQWCGQIVVEVGHNKKCPDYKVFPI